MVPSVRQARRCRATGRLVSSVSKRACPSKRLGGPGMGRSRFIMVLTLGARKFGESHAWGIGKSPLWAIAVTSPALIIQTVATENSQNRRAPVVGRFGNMHMNHSRPNESTRDGEIAIPRAGRVFRTIHLGLSTTAKASTQLTDTRRTKSKKSSFRIAGFVINHPILAMLVLALIALIGVGCIFALPIGWLPF